MRARLLILLWLLGIEVMPGLHQEFHHAGDHHHDGDQIVADEHHDDDDHHDADREVPQTEMDHPEHAHAGGGLAHRATALQAAAPPITKPLPIDRRLLYVVSTRSIAAVSIIGLAPSARGPPAAACEISSPQSV
jgi:hypothetical protein